MTVRPAALDPCVPSVSVAVSEAVRHRRVSHKDSAIGVCCFFKSSTATTSQGHFHAWRSQAGVPMVLRSRTSGSV
ncbi:hypothetical protein E2C01_065178 [Portunus trituberculatus]|uniref:Uncharacterized protein n=1 Tax=Portunus trituberculatus TaxID=210409 RepID=A0A5B7HLU6_PORTR|nr:hypothetical protein [Portunus trituberculatus]